MLKALKDALKKDYLATGVGSLPHTDPKKAVDLVLEAFEDQMPFWPQLPRRSFCENMYVQFTEKLPGIRVDENKRSVWVESSGDEYVGQFEECFKRMQSSDIDYFAVSRPYAESLYMLCDRLSDSTWGGWVKGQLIGPVSLGLTLLDEKKNPVIYNTELSEILPDFLALKAAWLCRQLRVTSEARVVIFVDEPYLVAVGTSQCSLTRETIIRSINRVVSVIHENNCLAGLHCCGNTDWEMVMGTDIDILNFDAYGYLDKLVIYNKAVRAFVQRGGFFAFGSVPNNEEISREGLTEELSQRLSTNAPLLENGALITTSCGCSGLSEDLTKKALETSARLAERLKGEF